MGKQQPLMQRHNEYVKKYIDPINRSTARNMDNFDNPSEIKRNLTRNTAVYRSYNQKLKPGFIYLNELITKGHKERVHDYLD
jgi:hypothetical protein